MQAPTTSSTKILLLFSLLGSYCLTIFCIAKSIWAFFNILFFCWPLFSWVQRWPPSLPPSSAPPFKWHYFWALSAVKMLSKNTFSQSQLPDIAILCNVSLILTFLELFDDFVFHFLIFFFFSNLGDVTRLNWEIMPKLFFSSLFMDNCCSLFFHHWETDLSVVEVKDAD